MRKWIMLQAWALILLASPVSAQEFRIGVGAFVFVEDGVDLQFSYRPQDSHWQYGYRYVSYTYFRYSPFSDRILTRSTETKTGPIVNYLFRPELNDSWYLGVTWLNWSRKETSLFTLETDNQSTGSLYFGGGYMSSLGKSFYWNTGIFLSPGAKLKTQTSVSSETSSGSVDIQIQLGYKF